MSISNWGAYSRRLTRFRSPPRWRSRRGDHDFDLGPGGKAVEKIVAVPQLLACFEHARLHGGQAPGPDGLRYTDFGRQELTRAFDAVRRAILDETYRAPPSRVVMIPKTGGLRQLELNNVVHRALASSTTNTLEPALKKDMSGMTHSACGRGVHSMFRDLYHGVEAGLKVVGNYDVRAAFPSLPIGVAMGAYRRRIADRRLLDLIELLLRGGDDPTRHTGIPQGLALSPLTLDLSMSWFFDRYWSDSLDSLVAVRYVDNLVFLTATKDEGHQAADRCRALLGRIGLSLKDAPEEKYIIDLNEGGNYRASRIPRLPA